MLWPVFRLIRTLMSLVFFATLLWCSFNVRLGRRTFAEHADRISQTPEAKELVDDARGTVTPVFRDAADRMLGEYIEAPTGKPVGTVPWRPPTAEPLSLATMPSDASLAERSGKQLGANLEVPKQGTGGSSRPEK